jgi:hypothetical protein
MTLSRIVNRQPNRSTCGSSGAGRVEGFLEAQVEFADAEGAAVHGAEDLDIADGIELKRRGMRRRTIRAAWAGSLPAWRGR